MLPLTPKDNATERHMLVVYLQAAERTASDLAAFWVEKLEMTREQIAALLESQPKFQNTVRAKLMKIGRNSKSSP